MYKGVCERIQNGKGWSGREEDREKEINEKRLAIQGLKINTTRRGTVERIMKKGYKINIYPNIECYLPFSLSLINWKVGQQINVCVMTNYRDKKKRLKIVVSVKHVPKSNFTGAMRLSFALYKNH